MGILSDFVIAKENEGAAIGESLRPADNWQTLEYKGIDPITVSTLYCAISGMSYTNEIQKSFELVGGNKEEGPWVFKFPEEILETIANAPVDNKQAIAEIWAATEELQMAGWNISDAVEFIKLIQVHAQKASLSKSTMFLWLSL